MVDIIRRLIVAGMALSLIAGNADQVIEFYDETVDHARHLATASDLRSIGNMLDYHYMRRGRYPRNDRFAQWLGQNFKENPVHTLGLDHWYQPLVYQADAGGKTFSLVSAGPDGFINTTDDLRITGP